MKWLKDLIAKIKALFVKKQEVPVVVSDPVVVVPKPTPVELTNKPEKPDVVVGPPGNQTTISAGTASFLGYTDGKFPDRRVDRVDVGTTETDHEEPEFAWSRPNSPRIFRNGTSKILKAEADCKIILHNGDMAGNVATEFTLIIRGRGASANVVLPTKYQSYEFLVLAGNDYTITTAATETLVMSIRFEAVPNS